MKKYKIFVSGVQKELNKEHRAIKDYILGDVLLSEYNELCEKWIFEKVVATGRNVQYVLMRHKCAKRAINVPRKNS